MDDWSVGVAGCVLTVASGGQRADWQLHVHVDDAERGISVGLPAACTNGDTNMDADQHSNGNGSANSRADYNRYAYDDAIAYVYRHLGANRGAADADCHRYLNTITITTDACASGEPADQCAIAADSAGSTGA